MTFGERIKKLRKELNLTQQEFADKIGTARDNIGGYETDRRKPSSSAISLIVAKLNVSEEWLRTGEGEMFIPTSDESIDELIRQHGLGDLERQIMIEFVQLDPRDRQGVLEYAKRLAANVRLRKQEANKTLEEEADEFAARAREQFLTEKKQALQASSANESAGG